MMLRKGGKHRGFTLLEMLLAVVVISVVGISLSSAIGSVANQTYTLERRTLAHWIGQNEVNRVRLDLRFNPRVLPEGKETHRVFLADREWDIEREVKSTESPLLRRVEISVYEVVDGDRVGPFDHLVSFVGRN